MPTSIRSPIASPATARSPLPSPTTTPARGGSFGDHVTRARSSRVVQTPAHSPLATAPAPHGITPSSPPGALTEASRQLLTRVARGERYVEGIVRQGLSGRDFTPADLLAMQAQVYRYTQELELVSKLVDRGTGTVKTILQQG